MPNLSAFVYESAKYIERADPSAVRFLDPHQDYLLTSRMRVKLIEDKYRSSAEVLDKANELVEINSGWFLKSNNWILATLQKPFLTDLGIYFMQNEFLTTTHIAFLNTGLTKEALSESSLTLDNLGPHIKARMVDVGRYIGGLAKGLGTGDPLSARGPEISLPPIQFRDLKSQPFYESIAHRVAPNCPSVSLLLTWMFSQINTARIIVPIIAEQNKVAAFKIRFVALFQIASSLRKLLEDNQKDSFLKPDAATKIGDLLNDGSVLKVQEAKGLRNNLVHYTVPKREASELSSNLPLFGLVEAHSNGRSLEAMRHDVALGLAYVSQGIRSLLPQTLKPQGTI
jgi:hypothetical protein